MSLPGAAKSISELLRAQYVARHGPVGAPSFELIGPAGLDDLLTDTITVFVYRIEQDPTRRYQELPPSSPGAPRRAALMVDVRFLLTAWRSDAEGELLLLARCMEILDDFPVLSGPLLHPAYAWDPDAALRVSLDHLTMEDSLRLWDALSPSFRLSVPYVIRTVRLSPTDLAEARPVDAAARLYVPGGGTP